VYYSYFDIKRNDDVPFEKQWGILSAVVAELDSYASVLLSDEGAAPPVTISTGGTDEEGGAAGWLSARARWAATPADDTDNNNGTARGAYYYLFVANDGNGAGKVTFTLDGGSSGAGARPTIGSEGVEVVSESPPRTIKPPGGKGGSHSFSDTIAALDVVVYRFKPAASADGLVIVRDDNHEEQEQADRWTYKAGSPFPSVWFGGCPYHSDVPDLRRHNIINYSSACKCNGHAVSLLSPSRLHLTRVIACRFRLAAHERCPCACWWLSSRGSPAARADRSSQDYGPRGQDTCLHRQRRVGALLLRCTE
jgi:hypothetical protein